MKYLLAFALIAVAMALPEPARLLEPVQLADPVAPLVVPQEVMDEVALKVKFVDAPEASEALEAVDAVNFVDAPVEAESDFAVNFVEEAVNVDAPVAAVAPEAAADFTVNIVEEAVNAPVEAPVDAVQFVDSPVENTATDFAVNFVEEAVNVDAPVAAVGPEAAADFTVNIVEQAVNAPLEAPVNAVQFVDAPIENAASDYAVNFVDEAVNVDAPSVVDPAESPILIKIVDLPLPGSVVMPLMIPTIGNVQVFDIPVEGHFAVKFVDAADMDEETPTYMPLPIKQYPSPMWR